MKQIIEPMWDLNHHSFVQLHIVIPLR